MDNEKKEVIVYGLGKDFAYWKTWIETKYNVLGYADSNTEKAEQYHPFLSITEIQDRQENVLIVSTDYYDEIKSLLIENGIDEKRIDGGVQSIIAPPVFVVTLWGGFSALMTCYCFAMAIQKLHPDTDLYFDMSYYEQTDRDDLKVVPYHFERLFRISLASRIADLDTVKRAKAQGITKEASESVSVYRKEYLQAEQGYIRGYWGTRKYYANIQEEIKEWFQFEKQYMNHEQKELLKKIKSTESVAIWIRRGDFLQKENWAEIGCICTEEYYDKAIQYIKEKYPNAEFFIFSNDPEYIKEKYSVHHLMLYNGNTSDMKDYDMYLMASCKHMILANSGFSWWAAFLHDLYGNAGTIIAPKEWMKDRPCSDIYEDSWIKM